jgi:hypothetical protein
MRAVSKWEISALIRTIRSFFSAFRASRQLGRVYRFVRAGKIAQAAPAAREGLRILSQPWVIRSNPAEGAALVCLVIELEQLRSASEDGAPEKDLVDAYLHICSLLPGSAPNPEYVEWLPYIEKRLGYVPCR